MVVEWWWSGGGVVVVVESVGGKVVEWWWGGGGVARVYTVYSKDNLAHLLMIRRQTSDTYKKGMIIIGITMKQMYK